jgi:hypothetical protein
MLLNPYGVSDNIVAGDNRGYISKGWRGCYTGCGHIFG